MYTLIFNGTFNELIKSTVDNVRLVFVGLLCVIMEKNESRSRITTGLRDISMFCQDERAFAVFINR
jgi:hypothetical protein